MAGYVGGEINKNVVNPLVGDIGANANWVKQNTLANLGLSTGGNKTTTTNKTVTPSTTGTSGGTSGGSSSSDINSLVGALASPDLTAYENAIKTEEAGVPLIQQRYQSLLDEINTNLGAGVSAYQTGEKESVSSAQARAGASGTYSGSTELGTEANIRSTTAGNISILESQATTQAEKAAAQANLDEQAVYTQVAQLGISEAQAEQSGLKDALSAIIGLENASTAAIAATTSQTVATTTPSGLLGLLGIGGGTTTTTKTPNAGTWN
jgi:hypothetical protein